MPLPRQVAIARREAIALAVEAQLPRTVREKVNILVHFDAFHIGARVVINDQRGNKYATSLEENCRLPEAFIADLCVRVG